MNAWINNWRKQIVQSWRKHHSLVVGIIIAVFIFSLGLATYAWARKDVTLVVDGKTLEVTTFKGQVGELLSQQGIELKPEDKVSWDLAAPLKDGMTIEIIRAFPVEVLADGQRLTVNTTPETVGKILELAKVTLGPHDQVEPDVSTVLEGPGEIKVSRITFKEIVQEKVIPYPTTREKNSNLDKGVTKVVQQGQNGLEKEIIKVTYQDGKEIKREVVKREVVKEPVPQRIAYGTRTTISRGGNQLEFRSSLTVTATAYSPTGKRTYSGTVPRKGTVAVDPRVIPLGSELYIDGYGYGKALDVGSAIKGNRIDVFMESEREARKWGSRKVKVYILK